VKTVEFREAGGHINLNNKMLWLYTVVYYLMIKVFKNHVHAFQKFATVKNLVEDLLVTYNEFLVPSDALYAHNFVLSLTTSPKRIKTLQLDTFANYSYVLLNLPKLFRNKEPYSSADIQALQSRIPNLRIHWLPEDLGPATKFLGALQVVKPSDIVVVIDDDILYNNGLLTVYDEEFKMHSEPVVITPSPVEYLGFTTAQGCHSYAVRVSDLWQLTQSSSGLEVYTKLQAIFNEYASAHPLCKRHDDVVFAAMFRHIGMPIHTVDFESDRPMWTVAYQDDALHSEYPQLEKNVECAGAIWDHWQQCPVNEGIQDFFTLLRSSSRTASKN
jgi:hypothetical protein